MANLAVPFTNSRAEQALCMAKLQRKISEGSHTRAGAESFSRMRDLVETARKQGAKPPRHPGTGPGNSGAVAGPAPTLIRCRRLARLDIEGSDCHSSYEPRCLSAGHRQGRLAVKRKQADEPSQGPVALAFDCLVPSAGTVLPTVP